jgi:hypothetical protein
MPNKATAKRPPMTPPAMGPESLLVWSGLGGGGLGVMVATPVDAKELV